MYPSALLCAFLMLPVLGPTLLAQQPYSQLSAAELTHAFVQRANSSSDDRQRYTFFILHHDLNYVHGIRTGEDTYKSEQIYIGGLPYVHRLEHNGKPLKGKELEHEDELYQKTLQERTGLTDDVRRKLLKQNTRSIQDYPADQLESEFHPEITGHPVIEGHPCILLDLTPLHPDAPPPLQRHILLTLDASNLNVLQTRIEILATDNGFRKGTVIENRNSYLNGVLMLASDSIDTTTDLKWHFIPFTLHLIGTDEYSNYRRFTTTVTLKSTSDPDVPASSTPPPQ
jgi:hypothetical protein